MRVKTLIVAILVLHALGSPLAESSQLTIADLLAAPGQYEGRAITLTAEVIGDVMLRGQNGWINVFDGTGSLGVFALSGLIEGLVPGRYGRTGDIIAITGVFNRSCTEHGGDMDIHASAIALVRKNESVLEPVKWSRYVVAFGLSLVLAWLWVDRLQFISAQKSQQQNNHG